MCVCVWGGKKVRTKEISAKILQSNTPLMHMLSHDNASVCGFWVTMYMFQAPQPWGMFWPPGINIEGIFWGTGWRRATMWKAYNENPAENKEGQEMWTHQSATFDGVSPTFIWGNNNNFP